MCIATRELEVLSNRGFLSKKCEFSRQKVLSQFGVNIYIYYINKSLFKFEKEDDLGFRKFFFIDHKNYLLVKLGKDERLN